MTILHHDNDKKDASTCVIDWHRWVNEISGSMRGILNALRQLLSNDGPEKLVRCGVPRRIAACFVLTLTRGEKRKSKPMPKPSVPLVARACIVCGCSLADELCMLLHTSN